MEAEKRRLEEELDKLRNDDRLQKELEFSEKLEALLVEHNKTSKEVIMLLDPSYGSSPAAATTKRKRALRIYTNPNTGEKVETYGGNNKTIRAWKEQYGEDKVKGWVEIID
jgi:hypothetical protein